MSLQSLGKRCGVSDTEILKIERGERQSPSCQALHRIAKELGFHPLELFKVAGYLSEEDLEGVLPISGLERLNVSQLSKVQSYVDFLNSDKEKRDEVQAGRAILRPRWDCLGGNACRYR